MTQPIDLDLLARYFDGTGTPEEAEVVRAWIGNDPERQTAVAVLASEWAADVGRLHAPYDAGAAWTRMAAHVSAPLVSQVRPRRSAETHRRTWHDTPIAARAAAIVFVVAIGGWWTFAKNNAAFSERAVVTQAERTYRTARAQRAIVRLSDGTEVTINAGSQLRVPADFGMGKRVLHLEGEAFFNVAHDSTAPFIVRTARGTAHDLGTRFNVRAYLDDRDVPLEVVVAEGAVALSNTLGRDSLVLRAAEAGWLTADGEIRAERRVDLGERLGWIEGRLEFRNAKLRDVLPVMSRWYDVELAAGDSTLADYSITATLTGERMKAAIDLVARALDARVVQRGSQMIFMRSRGGAR